MTLQRALVLGGGGVAGIAWETGVLAGLADAGVDAAAADYVLGTSAGSAVAAQLGSGLSWAELFRRQADPAAQNEELGLGEGVSVTELRDTWLVAAGDAGGHLGGLR
jgi:NTE family protein